MEQRISDTTRLLLLLFAAICDGVQVLLGLLWLTIILSVFAMILSYAITIFVLTVYGFIFMKSKVTPFTPKRVTGILIFELTPLIGQFMPSLTWWTWRVIHTSRIEDKERAKQNAKLEGERLEMVRRQHMRRAQVVAQRASSANQENNTNDNLINQQGETA